MQNTEKGQAPSLSFEFFPPHSPAANLRLWRTVERLAPLAPDFVSVTYGAGGTTRDRTNAAILTIRDRARLNVAGHLTCVGASRAETMATARSYAKMGVKHIVALRGDAPKGASKFEPHPNGFKSGVDLVAGLASLGQFRISVAAYPEKHPDSADFSADIQNLKRKFDAGADQAITQFFFEAETFLRFRDACDKAGITGKIIPGILPIEDFAKMSSFAARCHASVPDWMHQAYRNCTDDAQTAMLSVAISSELCEDLRDEGVNNFHVYTLNNPDLSYDLARALGVQPMALSMAAGNAVA